MYHDLYILAMHVKRRTCTVQQVLVTIYIDLKASVSNSYKMGMSPRVRT